MKSTYIVYIVAISLQLSGAILLLINAISTKRESLITNFSNCNFLSRDGNTHEISYNKNAFKKICETAYLNKFAFAFIASGYFAGIWGEIGDSNKCCIAICVELCTAILIFIAYFVVYLIAKYSKKVNAPITNEELEKLGIEPNMESMSSEELQKILSN